MKRILLCLLLLAPAPVLADPNTPDELTRLEATLQSVQQEQQSVFQSYQMTKERRRMAMEQEYQPNTRDPYSNDFNAQWPSYDDAMRAQMERERRIQQYSDYMKSLLERYLELERQRKSLIQRINELEQQPG